VITRIVFTTVESHMLTVEFSYHVNQMVSAMAVEKGMKQGSRSWVPRCRRACHQQRNPPWDQHIRHVPHHHTKAWHLATPGMPRRPRMCARQASSRSPWRGSRQRRHSQLLPHVMFCPLSCSSSSDAAWACYMPTTKPSAHRIAWQKVFFAIIKFPNYLPFTNK
jgi:hypothetical protein